MPVCYFNSNYDVKYSCNYELIANGIEINVDYDIVDEIEAINGIKCIGANTEFDNRDILIVDHSAGKNFTAKNAYYAGLSEVFGTPDGSAKTKFRASIVFEHNDLEKLISLPQSPNVYKIKVFSKSILDWVGCPSLTIEKTDESCNFRLAKKNHPQSVFLGFNNIKNITVSDEWTSSQDSKNKHIAIDFLGYIELELMQKISYEKVSEYINELIIFMQIYCPNRFSLNKIQVQDNETYFILNTPTMEIKCKNNYVEKAVSDNLLEFLKKCYTNIPYRNSKEEIRNIPYIVLKTSRSVEDSFLMFYRFIECYYKKTYPNAQSSFISMGLTQHYVPKRCLSEDQHERYTQEIISLRNHYVHNGYYIKNSSLRVSFKKINGKTNPKNYTADNVDAHWIYERTKILYEVVLDIIFKDMLGYEKYQYKNHF